MTVLVSIPTRRSHRDGILARNLRQPLARRLLQRWVRSNKMARPLRALLRIVPLLAMLVWPVFASADDKPASAYWMAAASNSPEVQWGRLVLKDGMLTFHVARSEWTTPLSEITRVAFVKGADPILEIVTASGETLQVSILGPQLLPESPHKAMQIIQRAVRQAPKPVVSVTTTFGTVKQ